jgi:exodeoxyribonuclease-3
MKIATWNVNSLRVRLEHVLRWLDKAQPDVLGLQETKVKDEEFPRAAFAELGYQSVAAGQAGYNGVAVLSRATPADVSTELSGFDDRERRIVAATFAGRRLINLYVPNGQRVDSEKYEYKLAWLKVLRERLRQELERYGELLVLGDFNIAPEDRDVHDPKAWEGHVLVSPAERAALGELLALGLHDAFRLFDQPERKFSWWDYRAGAFRRNRGLRIDLILASVPLSKMCLACSIDPEPRGWERPSDHAPVVAEFA